MSITYTQWLAQEYPACPAELLSFYRNALRGDFVANLAADEPYWYNYAVYSMPGAQHLDQTYNSYPAQPDRNTPPSMLEQDPGHLPNPTLCFLNSFGFPMHSWLLDCWHGLSSPSTALIKPKRSYWTGKPQRRRNLTS